MVILIPSYQPDRRLLDLLVSLADAQIVVVDDGSGPSYAHWFAAAVRAGAQVVHHDANRGKGQALRTGFAYIAAHFPGESVVCADSDGQHTAADIAQVAAILTAQDADLVLGVRGFTGQVPARSRLGNTVTRWLFRAATGMNIADTQTGLRAYPARMLGWLGGINGDRFEYELKVLLAASRQGKTIVQVPIATVYLDENSASHFRPVRDSWLIYRPLLKFCGSSLLGFALDCILLAVLLGLTGSLTLAVIGARLVSATVNYTVNRRFVFADGKPLPVRRTLPSYLGLALVLLGGNLVLMWTLNPLLGPTAAKILTELTLLAASYLIQRGWVFARRSHDSRNRRAVARSAAPR